MLQRLQLHLCCTPLGAVCATAAAAVILNRCCSACTSLQYEISPISFFPRAQKMSPMHNEVCRVALKAGRLGVLKAGQDSLRQQGLSVTFTAIRILPGEWI